MRTPPRSRAASRALLLPGGDARTRRIGRRVVAFSVLGLLLLIVALGVLKPAGFDAEAPEPMPAATPTDGRSPFAWHSVPALVFTGTAAGMLAGMLGMGGGILKMSCMLVFLKFDIFFARAVSIVTMFVSSASALSGMLKARLVVWPYALRMLTVATPAGIVTAIVGSSLNHTTLTLVFAIFVVFLGFNTIAFILGDPDEREMVERRADSEPKGDEGYRCGVIGGFHGATCGLLGISGGVVATPLQQLMVHMPLRRAIANTLLVSTVVTFIAGAIVLWHGVELGLFALSDVLFVDLFMGGAAAVGARIGTYVGERINVTALRLCFVALSFAAGGSILI